MSSTASQQYDVERQSEQVSPTMQVQAVWEQMKTFYRKHTQVILTLGGLSLALCLILLLTSLSYLEYHEVGLLMRRSTGTVDTSEVYGPGRYMHGPDSTFKKYDGDTHRVDLKELSVFSSDPSNDSVGLEFKVDITFTYTLIADEIGKLHEEWAQGYKKVVESRARAAIKNVAATVPFNDFFQDRDKLESRMAERVSLRLTDEPSLHANLDLLILGRVQIPDSVAQKQLDVKVQLERNSEEINKKAATLERSETDVLVNKVKLQAEYQLRVAEATAKLTNEQGRAEAIDIVESAKADGFAQLVEDCGLEKQEHILSFDYLRTVGKKAADDNAALSLTYLSDAVHTKGVER